MVLHKYIFMPIWSVINHYQYGQLTDKFDWQACFNADWSILPPISPDHDAGPALNQHWFICGQLRDDRRRK